MINSFITCLSFGCFLLVNGGKLGYYNDRLPVDHPLETVPASYYWPQVPSDEPDAIHYPTWFQLPWRPIFLQQPVVQEELEKNTLPPGNESPPSADTEDDDQEGRHLHHEKPHKHHHHHKHKHHKHKHHKHHHHHQEDKGTKTAGTPVEESEELQYANVGQLKMVMIQLEHKLQELKLQLFGSRTLTNDDDSARVDDHNTNGDPEAIEEMEASVEDASRVLTDITATPVAEKDEGKALLQEDDKPAAELELEHREMEPNPFDNGRSLTENVQKWFEGLDLGKIGSLPLEESVESEDVAGTIDVRGSFK